MTEVRITPTAFRAAMGRFATGVTVVTTVHAGEPHGMTANAVTSVSLEPPLVLVCVDHAAVLRDLLSASGVYGVSVLALGQRGLSERFAAGDRPRGWPQFAGVATTPGAGTGVPLLDGTLMRMECVVAQEVDAGDHTVFIGEVCSLDVDPEGEPLLYLDGDYAAAHTAPGSPTGPDGAEDGLGTGRARRAEWT